MLSGSSKLCRHLNAQWIKQAICRHLNAQWIKQAICCHLNVQWIKQTLCGHYRAVLSLFGQGLDSNLGRDEKMYCFLLIMEIRYAFKYTSEAECLQQGETLLDRNPASLTPQ